MDKAAPRSSAQPETLPFYLLDELVCCLSPLLTLMIFSNPASKRRCPRAAAVSRILLPVNQHRNILESRRQMAGSPKSKKQCTDVSVYPAGECFCVNLPLSMLICNNGAGRF